MGLKWDGPPLTPWERETIARMEAELGGQEAAVESRLELARRPVLFGVVLGILGVVLTIALVDVASPLGLSGFIVALLGMLLTWDEL